MTETILREAQRLVHGDRQKAYGHPRKDFVKTAWQWTGVLWEKLKVSDLSDADKATLTVAEYLNLLITPEDIPMCMIGVKVSREVHKHQRENLTDICGYVATRMMLEDEK